MNALRRMIHTVASSQATVLITGESGCGKELIARALHRASERAAGRFVAINCGAIPRDLMESELFGHRKGAFTGAVVDRIGRFEQAHGGTIFLDEIGDLPLEMQVKLLRVLQERVVDAVGSTQPTRIDVRVIAATHRDLEEEVAAGRFREDLFYRLNVLPLVCPPLRERSEDVPALLEHHAQRSAPAGCAPIRFDTEMLEALQAYRWPGNVRELANLVDRFTTLFCGRTLSLRDVPVSMLPKGLHAAHAQALVAAARQPGGDVRNLMLPSPPSRASEPHTDVAAAIALAQGTDDVLPADGLCLKEHLARLERRLLEQALHRTGGNVSQTARLLQLQRTTLIEKLSKYELRVA